MARRAPAEAFAPVGTMTHATIAPSPSTMTASVEVDPESTPST